MDDALSTLLRHVQPRGALFDRSIVDAPWSLRIEDEAPLTLLTLLNGDGWIKADGGQSMSFGAGDVALVSGREPYVVSDTPGTQPTLVVRRSDLCTTPDGRAVDENLDMCASGDPPTGASVLLKGTYEVQGSVSDRVLRSLPPLVVVPAGEGARPTMELILTELRDDKPGQQVVLDRLLDLLLVSTLRDWFERPDSDAPAWYQAQSDPVVGRALRLIHDDPSRPWTVAGLASASGASRAGFARRFMDLVGEPPMAYLTCWRLCLAADLLRQTDATVGSIARQVGYANVYALSVAFKRVHGIRPTEHRAAA